MPKNRVSNKALLFSAIVIFCLTALLITPNRNSENITNLLGSTTFIFGTFTAFTVSNSINRLSKIRESLKQGDASLLNLYHMSLVFPKTTSKEIVDLLDNHLIAQIDYYLYDFKYTYPTFAKLYYYILKLKTHSEKETTIWEQMVDVLKGMTEQRKILESHVRETISSAEWLVIINLQMIILFCLFLMNDGTLISSLTTVILATTSIGIMIVIRNFNNLRWKEDTWAWQPLEELFLQIDRVPYFPKEVLQQRRAKPKVGSKARIAYYPNPYPDMTGKVVKLEVVNKGRL